MSLRVIDLFAGAGGLSVGFAKAGFEIPLAIEQDLWATDTYAHNHPNTKLIVKDIREIPNEDFRNYIGADVVAGGPPCQGFSIAASNRRQSNDPRNLLYLEFLRVVAVVNPKVVLIENVKEIRKFLLPDGRLLCDDIQERLDKLGYASHILTLNASNFGVPQDRTRTFVLAAKNAAKLSEAVAQLITAPSRSTNIEVSNPVSKEDLTLWNALSDLPKVTPWKVTESSVIKYASKPLNKYQSSLRREMPLVLNHVPMRHTPRMIERFEHFISNVGNDNVPMPAQLTPRTRGNPEIASGIKFDQNHRILEANKLSPTITASFYSSFIHPFQPRNLTVREAARLQSFPDDYLFKGKRTTLSKKLLAKKGITSDLYLDQFNQVGNSVPPLLAFAIAKQIQKILEV